MPMVVIGQWVLSKQEKLDSTKSIATAGTFAPGSLTGYAPGYGYESGSSA